MQDSIGEVILQQASTGKEATKLTDTQFSIGKSQTFNEKSNILFQLPLESNNLLSHWWKKGHQAGAAGQLDSILIS